MKRKNPAINSVALPREPRYLSLKFTTTQVRKRYIDWDCVQADPISAENL